MISWALEVEYDGTGFMGWQRQKHGLAIQQVMEEAGAKLCNGVIPAAVASGRTDAGVHALGQIVQMELPDFSPHRLREALNYHMKPHAVVVVRAAPAPAVWSARFSAISRSRIATPYAASVRRISDRCEMAVSIDPETSTSSTV